MVAYLKVLGPVSIAVVVITVVVFVVALFVKGFTHTWLLEAAVFLVSVKLIIITVRINQGVESIEQKLDLVLSGEK